MPVEIRELIIKAEIVQDDSGKTESTSSPTAQSPNEKIVELCVEKVLEILKEKNGR